MLNSVSGETLFLSFIDFAALTINPNKEITEVCVFPKRVLCIDEKMA